MVGGDHGAKMRYCCDEKCDQGRDCPAKNNHIPDWVDGFAIGVYLSAAIVLIVFILVN